MPRTGGSRLPVRGTHTRGWGGPVPAAPYGYPPRMAPDTRGNRARPQGPNPLRSITFTALAVFLTSWFLCWFQAYGFNDDLPHACGDVRRQVFPTEVACVSVDGTVTGATPGWLVVLFFASLVVTVLAGAMAMAVTAAVRER